MINPATGQALLFFSALRITLGLIPDDHQMPPRPALTGEPFPIIRPVLHTFTRLLLRNYLRQIRGRNS